MILILNCGSQSIKWKLFDESLKQKKEGGVRIRDAKNYSKGLISELKRIKDFNNEITIVGHRVVHSGGAFKSPLTINSKNLKKLETFNSLAPLHNPFNVAGIKFSQSTFPQARQFAVFDTDFFSTLPEKAFGYALPEKLVKKFGIRRYGFQGISHEWAANEAAALVGKPLKDLKIITCHLGGGASVCAIDKGKTVDTSMGFTPLEGLVMMTRSGNIDPGIIFYLQNNKVKNLDYILNNESGIKGLCGMFDMREVLAAAARGSASRRKKAVKALDIYAYSIQKYIGAYYATLCGCDLLVFTGAIGSGSAKIVNMICKDLSILKDTKVLSIKPDEELSIAKKIASK
jgi:acetate kinase